jgi:HNH endonuclease
MRMAEISNMVTQALRRDGMRCRACGFATRAALTVHHKIPLGLNGPDSLANLTTLCANCHRIVHWLSTGDRAVEAHGYGLAQSPLARRRLLTLVRTIRLRRLQEIGPDLMQRSVVPFASAIQAVATRNGFDAAESRLFGRCIRRAVQAIAPADRKRCSVRLVRRARFISVNANNHLVIRAPAFSDAGYRLDGDMLIVWPQAVRPSILTAAEFRRASSSRFKLIPHFNLSITWDECQSLVAEDWSVFRRACHDALTLARTRRWTSNVAL